MLSGAQLHNGFLMGLTPSTTYDFYVKEAYAPGDTSMTMYCIYHRFLCGITLGNPQPPRGYECYSGSIDLELEQRKHYWI